MRPLKALAALALLFGAAAQADVAQRMRGMFDSLGAYSQVDGPRYLSAQSRHVFSGGGLSYRAPRQTYQLLGVTPPSLAAGCGGIDLYAGSFSFINKEQFVQMLNNIAANSVGLAFKTALCSTSANLCQAIEDLQKTLQSLNRFNIDSCETAKQLVGGFVGASEQVAQTACQANSRAANLASDASEARQMCATPTGYSRSSANARTGAGKDSQPAEFVGGNLTWDIIAKTASGLDRQDKEFLQSMLGTHVVTTLSLSLRYHPPTITSIGDLNSRTVTLLGCVDVDRCLQVQTRAVTLSTSFLDLAAERLADISRRLQDGSELTAAQLNLVAGAPVPVLALVQADAAGAAGLTELAAEAVAYASAYHFLTSSLRHVASASSAWRSRSVNEAELARAMVDDSRQLRMALAVEMHAALERVAAALETSERLRELRYWLTGDALGQPPSAQ